MEGVGIGRRGYQGTQSVTGRWGRDQHVFVRQNASGRSQALGVVGGIGGCGNGPAGEERLGLNECLGGGVLCFGRIGDILDPVALGVPCVGTGDAACDPLLCHHRQPVEGLFVRLGREGAGGGVIGLLLGLDDADDADCLVGRGRTDPGDRAAADAPGSGDRVVGVDRLKRAVEKDVQIGILEEQERDRELLTGIAGGREADLVLGGCNGHVVLTVWRSVALSRRRRVYRRH